MIYQTIKHCDASPNSEKAGAVLDSKALSWQAVVKQSCVLSIRKWLSVVPQATLISVFAISGCGSDHTSGQDKLTQQEKASANQPVHKEVGEASWYGPGFQGKETANGETFDQKELTAAHPNLPMGTKAKVTNLDNGKKVDVRINDRGPYVGDRVIDLSGAAAKKLDMKGDGTTEVKIETKPVKAKRPSKQPDKAK